MNPIASLFILLSIIVLSCQRSDQQTDALFYEPESRGSVSRKLEEASALVASYSNPGYLWSINDSGNKAEIYLIDDEATIVMTCKLIGIENRDWESIALSRNDSLDSTYLYIGETGDNDARYELKYLYKINEPQFDKDDEIEISDVETLVIKLEDGPRDMEAIAIDHFTGDMLLISKREEQVITYLIPEIQFVEGDTILPRKIGTLPYHNVVAADISLEGTEVLIKTYDEIYYWKRENSELLDQLLKKPPTILSYKREPQGEAVAWDRGGVGFYTLSESVDDTRARLYYYKKR